MASGSRPPAYERRQKERQQVSELRESVQNCWRQVMWLTESLLPAEQRFPPDTWEPGAGKPAAPAVSAPTLEEVARAVSAPTPEEVAASTKEAAVQGAREGARQAAAAAMAAAFAAQQKRKIEKMEEEERRRRAVAFHGSERNADLAEGTRRENAMLRRAKASRETGWSLCSIIAHFRLLLRPLT